MQPIKLLSALAIATVIGTGLINIHPSYAPKPSSSPNETKSGPVENKAPETPKVVDERSR